MNFESRPIPWAWLAAIVFAGLSYAAQLQYDTWRRFSPPKVHATYNEFIEPQPLSPALARAASFGATEFVADWYWLQTIQYYGGGDPYGKYRKLAELFNTVTDLSPKFKDAYQTGLIILPGEGFVNEAIALGEKGQKNLPDSWEMPYYTGLVYHMYKKDFVKAAEQFQHAAALPSAPANARLFAGIYYNKANDRQTAYLIFKTVYDSTQDEFIRDRAKKYVLHLEAYFTLEDGIAAYKKQFGRLPSSLDELVSKKIIAGVPESPLGVSWAFDPKTGQLGEGKRN
jgi:hypothetical protein